jgi:hypothetical protein
MLRAELLRAEIGRQAYYHTVVGTLGGNGTVASTTVNNGGTLAPGNSIGTITINGNLVFGAGAIYRVEVSPATADRTNVTGTATLGGTAQLVFQPGEYFSRSYTILSAAGGRTGTFNTVTTENKPAVLTASLTYTPTDVLLVTMTSNMAQVAGTTPNQKAVAAAQDFAFNNALPSISALFGLTPTQLPVALDALSGEVHVSTAGVLLDESRYIRQAVLGRLQQASYGGDMGAMAALAIGGLQAAFVDGAESTRSPMRSRRSSPRRPRWPRRAAIPCSGRRVSAPGAGSTRMVTPLRCGAISRASSPASTRASATQDGSGSRQATPAHAIRSRAAATPTSRPGMWRPMAAGVSAR